MFHGTMDRWNQEIACISHTGTKLLNQSVFHAQNLNSFQLTMFPFEKAHLLG